MPPAVAKIITDLALDREFDYRIPAELQDTVVKEAGQGGLRAFGIAMIRVNVPMVGERVFTLPLTVVYHEIGGMFI